MKKKMLKQYAFWAMALLPLTSFALTYYYFSDGMRLRITLIPIMWSFILIYFYSKKNVTFGLSLFFISWTYVVADSLNRHSDYNPIEQTLYYLFYSIFMMGMFIISGKLLYNKSRVLAWSFCSALTFLFLLIPCFYIIFYIKFDAYITTDVTYAILQTNPREAYEFIISSGLVNPIILFILIISILPYSFFVNKHRKIKKAEIYVIILSTLFFGIITHGGLKQRIVWDIFSYVKEYHDKLKSFQELQKRAKNNNIHFLSNKEFRGESETYMIIIGESLNKRHMGLYGYFRKTTPMLSTNKDLLIFNNAYSNHTHTAPTLSLALTEANQYNKLKYYQSLSIINILNKANIETSLITNQPLYGLWSDTVSIIANNVNHLVHINKHIGNKHYRTLHFDGAVLEKVEEILTQKASKHRVIFVHLMGSHGDYCSRFPKKFRYFKGQLPRSIYGRYSYGEHQERVNCYDNSVLYNDFVVHRLLDLLKKKSGRNGFIYFPDHSEDVLNGLYHSAPKFTYAMTDIPLIAWFSEEYQSYYNEKYNILKDRLDTVFSNDLIFDLLIGIFGIKTDRHEKHFDLSSKEFNLKEEQALVLHGKKKYVDPQNERYIQKVNVRNLINSGQDIKIFPQGVNTLGKLKDIWADGYKAFEIDVRFDKDKDCLHVGHDKQTEIGVCLIDFLKHIPVQEVKKIWVDLKNLNLKNYKKVLKILSRIKKSSDIKEQFIIEFSSTIDESSVLSQGGYHTSYYLPTNKIIKMLKENDESAMKGLARRIVRQSHRQKLSALSFDYRAYPFVKNFVEPKLSSSIAYHLWDMDLSLKDIKFFKKIKNKNYYKDKRVKTILIFYKSMFHL